MVVTAVITMGAWFLSVNEIKSASSTLYVWCVILGAFAVAGLGPLAILLFHITQIRRRARGQWLYSVWLIIVMFITIITGVFISPMATNAQFTWIYNNVQLVISAGVNGLLAFWIVSAAFRAFKVRTWEAFILFMTAVFVIFLNAPFGGAIWPGFGTIGTWIMNVPNNAVFRGIVIASAIGVIALGFRTLLGYERGAMGRE
jgi:hypothetical protein